MKYKEFTKWYNQRLCEGLWSEKDAIYCTNILDMLRQLPFWTRKRVWNKIRVEFELVVIEPINKQIRKMNREQENENEN